MFERVWKFLQDKRNQNALRLIGSAVFAIGCAVWAVWQYFASLSPKPTATGSATLRSIPVSPPTYSGQNGTRARPVLPQPTALQAEAGDGGVAIVVTDKAKVNVRQTVGVGNPSNSHREKIPDHQSPAGTSARSGEQGISVVAKDSAEVNVKQKVH